MVGGAVTTAVKDGHALELEGMTKSFGSTRALVEVGFTVSAGRIHALLGGNGSGKSTLIKALAGVQAADSGTVTVGGRIFDARALTAARAWAAGLRFVHQQSSTFPDLSIAENLALGHGYETGAGGRVRWRRLRSRAGAVMDRFGIHADPETSVGELGPAMRTMVAIARALQDQEAAHEGVLVLDEPTASLPPAEVDVLLAAIQRYAEAGQTIIFVTHRLDEVLRVADEVTVLRDGHVAARLGREGLDHDALVAGIMGEAVEPERVERTGAAGAVFFRSVAPGGGAVEVRAGEVVGVAGLLGSGRTALLRSFFGAGPRPVSVELDGIERRLNRPRDAIDAGIAYIPEDRTADAAFGELGVKENISITLLHDHWVGVFRTASERCAARQLMGSLSIKAASEEAPLGSLSGGNQQKVILARWLQRTPRLLLLDEPTQGVDIGARIEIHRIVRDLASRGAGALVVSSDSAELAALCDRAIVIRRGRVVDEVRAGDLTEEALNIAVYRQGEPA